MDSCSVPIRKESPQNVQCFIVKLTDWQYHWRHLSYFKRLPPELRKALYVSLGNALYENKKRWSRPLMARWDQQLPRRWFNFCVVDKDMSYPCVCWWNVCVCVCAGRRGHARELPQSHWVWEPQQWPQQVPRLHVSSSSVHGAMRWIYGTSITIFVIHISPLAS